jgi:hypothetical protein
MLFPASLILEGEQRHVGTSLLFIPGDTWKIRSETVEVTKKEVSTQSPTPTPSNR